MKLYEVKHPYKHLLTSFPWDEAQYNRKRPNLWAPIFLFYRPVVRTAMSYQDLPESIRYLITWTWSIALVLIAVAFLLSTPRIWYTINPHDWTCTSHGGVTPIAELGYLLLSSEGKPVTTCRDGYRL